MEPTIGKAGRPMATAKAENTFTVFRRQVVQTGKFEPAEASCSVTVTLAGDEDQEAVANLIAEWGTTLEIANWEKKLDPNANFNKNGPDYKRRADGKGIWLTKKDGSSLVPEWFVCPFTGKSANELADIGTSIRA